MTRPIHHRLEDRVRAHVLLCMLAYYLEWHLRQAWAELLFDDEHPAPQPDPAARATRSPQAARKAQTKRNRDGLPLPELPRPALRTCTAHPQHDPRWSAPMPPSTSSPSRPPSSAARSNCSNARSHYRDSTDTPNPAAQAER
jgi:hypothetical protein